MDELDRRLRAEDERRKAWQARRDAQRDGGGGGPGAGIRTEEGRNLRAKARIDQSTAESRARRAEYRRLRDQRRVELGLAPGR